jgi:hypothetical protein
MLDTACAFPRRTATPSRSACHGKLSAARVPFAELQPKSDCHIEKHDAGRTKSAAFARAQVSY